MINILFGGNNKVYNGILLCSLSIIKHTNEPLNIFILTADLRKYNPDYTPITESQISILNKVLKNKNSNSNAQLILLNEDFENWIMNSANKLSSYTPFAFLRLFADKVELPDKLIYLDTDIMLNGDINELYNTDISNHELGVVLDRYGQVFIKANYFNSGVLLMNMKKLKESNMLEKVRNLCSNKKMPFPDQDALNKLCKNKLYLPRKFNEQGNPKKDTIIQHFSKRIVWFPFHTINIKPWHIEKVQKRYKIHIYDDIYKEYNKLISLNNNLQLM